MFIRTWTLPRVAFVGFSETPARFNGRMIHMCHTRLNGQVEIRPNDLGLVVYPCLSDPIGIAADSYIPTWCRISANKCYTFHEFMHRSFFTCRTAIRTYVKPSRFRKSWKISGCFFVPCYMLTTFCIFVNYCRFEDVAFCHDPWSSGHHDPWSSCLFHDLTFHQLRSWLEHCPIAQGNCHFVG